MRVLTAAIAILAAATAALAQTESYLTQDEVRAIVAEVLADAETRSSMLQDGYGGHEGAFTIRDADGKFTLRLSGYAQFRYTASFRDAGGASDDFESGFTTRRTKLTFRGHVYDPRLTYRTTFAFNRLTGSAILEIATIGWEFNDNWSIELGQKKLPFLREESMASTRQMAVDRSPTTEIFNQFFSQGIWLQYEKEDFRSIFAVSDGLRSENTDFTRRRAGSLFGSALVPGESDYALTLRAEQKFGGSFKQFDDFTGTPGQDAGTLLGAAVHLEGGDKTSTIGGNSYHVLAWVADAQLEGDGWSAFASLNGFHTSAESNFDDYGLVTQIAGYVPDTNLELFARYDITLPDDARQNSDPFDTITVGGTYFFHGHAAKLLLDVQWFLSDTLPLPGAGVGIGYLQSANPNGIAIRMQYQLIF